MIQTDWGDLVAQLRLNSETLQLLRENYGELEQFWQKPLVMTSQNLANGKTNSSSIAVKVLIKSEIKSLRQSKVDAYKQMMAMS
ncbi:hypothetical protein [Moraxella equi]|uniref:Uncharacterized protein n=1 Tax=Moraxella equi TaxID=60442 RepID=A0A378QNW8_9GAMM|nr:hypothetical protein [Moraxella equi]OPH39937.1 hypothetical protein B5J93_01650 [Moraxella equi]STZ02555.1 Uncharacterised protein [Moraxella equi]